MTHSVDEALAVHKAWKDSGKVMQVGVQSTALPVWKDARQRICDGQLGKVLMYQTEFFRNSDVGQWRYYPLSADMTPKNIDWKMFLGTELSLAPDMPFDRAKFAQWRCYWDFGAGMFTDLFVHRTTSMLTATGLRFPGRVVGAGGIFLEYDGRDVPDVATVVADFPEGVQGLVTATMCCAETPIQQVIRGHNGSFVFGNGEEFAGYDFVAERPQVTHDSKIKSERIEVGKIDDTSLAHFKNFCESAIAGKPDQVNCSPELGAAAMVIVKLGSHSYREGKVFHFDRETMTFREADTSWAKGWEKMSHNGAVAQARARLESRRHRQQALPARVPEAGRPVDQRPGPGRQRRRELISRCREPSGTYMRQLVHIQASRARSAQWSAHCPSCACEATARWPELPAPACTRRQAGPWQAVPHPAGTKSARRKRST